MKNFSNFFSYFINILSNCIILYGVYTMKNHIHNFVYEIENLETGRKYIGSKTSDNPISNTNGFGIEYYSSMVGNLGDEFRNDQKSNPEKFKYTILEDYKSKEEMYKEEARLHDLFHVDKNPMFYNRAKQTSKKFFYDKGTPWTEERRRKWSEKVSGDLNPNYGKKASEETRKKMSIARKGSHRNEETKRKMSESRRKVEERRKELGIIIEPWNKGVKMSEEFCYRLHLLRKDKGMKGKDNPMYGVKRKTKICEYCGKEISELNYVKWHGKLCKENPDYELYESERQTPHNKGKKCTEEQRLKNIEYSKKSTWHSKKVCEYCGKEVDCGNYKQWHGEKCKYKTK